MMGRAYEKVIAKEGRWYSECQVGAHQEQRRIMKQLPGRRTPLKRLPLKCRGPTLKNLTDTTLR